MIIYSLLTSPKPQAITIYRSKQLAELTTITVSVHRVKSPVPTISYINTKGWARGRRTVAGTMVLTKLTTDVLASFLTSSAFTSDLSKDSQYVKVDQLPPFNISMLFSDEYGHMSYPRILGIEFVTSGDVYSIQDMLSDRPGPSVLPDTKYLARARVGQLQLSSWSRKYFSSKTGAGSEFIAAGILWNCLGLFGKRLLLLSSLSLSGHSLLPFDHGYGVCLAKEDDLDYLYTEDTCLLICSLLLPAPIFRFLPRAGTRAGSSRGLLVGTLFNPQKKYPSRHQIKVSFCAVEGRGNMYFPLQHWHLVHTLTFSTPKTSRLSIGEPTRIGDFTLLKLPKCQLSA